MVVSRKMMMVVGLVVVERIDIYFRQEEFRNGIDRRSGEGNRIRKCEIFLVVVVEVVLYSKMYEVTRQDTTSQPY